MTELSTILPWLLAFGLLAVFFLSMKKTQGLNQELDNAKTDVSNIKNDLTIAQERLAAQVQQQAMVKEQLASAQEENRSIQHKFDALSTTHAKLGEEAASLRPLTEQLAKLESAKEQMATILETTRKENKEITSLHAALTSRLEEEQNSAKEQEVILAQAHDKALQEKEQRIAELSTERNNLRTSLDQAVTEKNNLAKELATIQTKTSEQLQAADEKISLLKEAEKKLTTGFENLANRIFEEKQQKFHTESKESMENLLSPMRQQLKDFRDKVEKTYDKENEERISLRNELKELKNLNERISADAINLTEALKGDSKKRGNWGEMQLKRLLEQSGLQKGRNYDIQVSLKDENGTRFQPDVVVHLPENKDVIIDSKVSLVAYEQYYAADTEEERQRHIASHIASMRTHIKDLSAKNYDELIGVNSLDLVIMFVPIEPALLLAFEHEQNLFTEAFDKRILLVSPSTLNATLQIINNIWRYEDQNQNALEIAREAGNLHDKFVGFVNALQDIGKHLDRAAASYGTAHKRLTSGSGNLVTRTQKLQELGAKTKKQMDNQLVELAAENNTPALPGANSEENAA